MPELNGTHTSSAVNGARTADVLIIGGGVIGLAIAWRAAQRGLRVVLADPEPGRGASYAAAGMLTPVAEAAYAERALFELGSASLERYPAFAAEVTEVTGLPTGFRQTGTLQVGYDADDMAMLAEHALLRESFGAASSRLTSRECRKAEPMIGPAIAGGLLVDGDASIDPRLLTTAMLAACAAAGVMHLRQQATCLQTDGDRASGATLADGSVISADRGRAQRGLGIGCARRAATGRRTAAAASQGADHQAAPGAGERCSERLSVSS